VIVASQSSLGIAVVALSSVDAPDDDGLVTGSRNDNVGVLSRGGDGGNPTSVALEHALKR